MKLGCCYYPEHWPESMWVDDARRMKALGLSLVRIGEFAWSRIEPDPGRYDWPWLDRAIQVLADAGLKIILGTPTATPPKWLVDAHPDILPLDPHGHPRTFASRRHYCFSSKTYLEESKRITTALAERYGAHPAVVMWQTDNEFGCHDTVISYSDDARAAFRVWLEDRYGDVRTLNEAWGNVFWSMEYRSFDEVDPPAATVTEPNPAHVMAWRRFSSGQVRRFHDVQAAIIRRLSPGRDITHNFMGHFTEFDHHAFAKDAIDLATWDSYPLGFLEQAWWPEADKVRFARTGHPDFAAFHHDLYRGIGRGRWGIMEQQPGPVNWGAYNPAPLPGMVALWTLEAAAHGAEFVSYFRWRQAPFAQEQMHAGLNRPDNLPDTASEEAANVLQTLAKCGDLSARKQAEVALVYDYEAEWATNIQPQGRRYNYSELAFLFYEGLRRFGANIDIVGPQDVLTGYRLVVLPGNTMCPGVKADNAAQIVLGPRTGSKTAEFSIPEGLAPGTLAEEAGLRVRRVESLRPGLTVAGSIAGERFEAPRWREFIESDLPPIATFDDGEGAVFRNGQVTYIACWPDCTTLTHALAGAFDAAGLVRADVPEAVRIRRTGDLTFAFNYGENIDLQAAGLIPEGARIVSGSVRPGPAGVTVWTI